jgi:hypothetical protein
VYKVDAVKPFNKILPVDVEQFDGFIEDELVITGVGFTNTEIDADVD